MAQLSLNHEVQRPQRTRTRRVDDAASWKQSRGLDALALTSALFLNILALAMPLAVLQIYDVVIANRATETLSALCVGLAIVALLEAVLRLAQGQMLAVSAQRAAHQEFNEAIERELGEAPEGADRVSAERRLERFRAHETYTEFRSGDQRRNLIDMPFAVIFLIALALISGWLVLAPVAIIIVALMNGRPLLRRSRNAAKAREEGLERNAEFVAEVLAAPQTVKALGAQALMARRQERLSAAAGTHFRANSIATSDIQTAVMALTSLGSIATIALGATLAIAGQISIGALAACSIFSARALQPILRGLAALAERETAHLAARTCAPLFSPEIKRFHERTPRRSDGAPRIDFEAVTIVAEDQRVVCDEASFQLSRGSLTLLETSTPSDALALMRVAAGLAAPVEGRAMIDGIDAPSNRGGLGEIALLTSETALFQGTIVENLTLFGAGCDIKDGLQAVRALGLEPTLNALPSGFGTRVGEAHVDALHASNEMQLLLARSIAQKPRLLLLDDPFSALEPEAADALLGVLERLKGQTTILIRASKPGLAPLADAHIAIDGGILAFRQTAATPPEKGRNA